MTLVRYWMTTRYARGLLIVEAAPMGRIVGGCPIYIETWRKQTLRAFFRWHAKRGGCEWEEVTF